jgi:hypothetical protein
MNIEFITEIYASLYYWKHESKIIAKSHVLLKWNQNNNKNMW